MSIVKFKNYYLFVFYLFLSIVSLIFRFVILKNNKFNNNIFFISLEKNLLIFFYLLKMSINHRFRMGPIFLIL